MEGRDYWVCQNCIYKEIENPSSEQIPPNESCMCVKFFLTFYLGTVLHDCAIVSYIHAVLYSKNMTWSGR